MSSAACARTPVRSWKGGPHLSDGAASGRPCCRAARVPSHRGSPEGGRPRRQDGRRQWHRLGHEPDVYRRRPTGCRDCWILPVASNTTDASASLSMRAGSVITRVGDRHPSLIKFRTMLRSSKPMIGLADSPTSARCHCTPRAAGTDQRDKAGGRLTVRGPGAPRCTAEPDRVPHVPCRPRQARRRAPAVNAASVRASGSGVAMRANGGVDRRVARPPGGHRSGTTRKEEGPDMPVRHRLRQRDPRVPRDAVVVLSRRTFPAARGAASESSGTVLSRGPARPSMCPADRRSPRWRRSASRPGRHGDSDPEVHPASSTWCRRVDRSEARRDKGSHPGAAARRLANRSAAVPQHGCPPDRQRRLCVIGDVTRPSPRAS